MLYKLALNPLVHMILLHHYQCAPKCLPIFLKELKKNNMPLLIHKMVVEKNLKESYTHK